MSADPENDLEERHPGWSVWQSDSGRWWAARRHRLTPAQLQAGLTPHLRADTPDELADLISDQSDQEATA